MAKPTSGATTRICRNPTWRSRVSETAPGQISKIGWSAFAAAHFPMRMYAPVWKPLAHPTWRILRCVRIRSFIRRPHNGEYWQPRYMQTAYDELPYLGAPFDQTHPDHLATLAILFGMTPAPVDRCSVLELGCGDGGNLIPMAFALPQSRFTGIDLAGSAIAR